MLAEFLNAENGAVPEDVMGHPGARVLLLGKDDKDSSLLARHLEDRGFRCWVAGSAEEGAALFGLHDFHLVLSVSSLRQATRIAALLGASRCSVFHAQPVETSCWWLPVMHGGERCLGAPALRAHEFNGVLEKTLQEIEKARGAAPGVSESDYPRNFALQTVGAAD